ncbi:MFS transporter [Amycolatopsis nivea]|uniref:MFS transporter n=1 Tax=Amycolatopsis nivea TaxID=1644109 RepID=UPI00107048B6|nr:MFS transporter [Amycolatopsis nivea]
MPFAAPPSPDAPRSIRRRAWAVTALIAVFMVINFADKAVLGLAAVPIMRELHLSNSTYGLLASSFYLLFSITSLAAGLLSAKVASRWILFALAVCWAVAQVPVLAFAAVPTLFASRVLLGAAEGPASGMSMHALYKWFPDERRSLPTALQLTGGSAGIFVAAPLLTWIITDYGWRAAFVVLAVVAGLWALVWLPVGHDGPYAAPTAAATNTEPARVPYRKLLLNGTVFGGFASAFGAYWSLALGSSWLPAYLQTEAGFGPKTSATVISLHAALSIVLILTVVPATGRLVRRGVSSRWARGATQGIAVALAGVCMALFPLTTSDGLRVVLIMIAFAAGSLAYPLGYLTAGELVPVRQRGTVFGLAVAISTLPGIIAPAVTGSLIDHYGYPAAFAVGAAIMVLTGAYAAFAIRPQRDAARIGLSPAPNIRPATSPAQEHA